MNGKLAERLHGVRVQQGPARVNDVGDLSNRLDRADFVVGVHHGNKRRPIRERLGHLVRVNAPVGVGGKKRDIEAQRPQKPGAVQHGLMLDLRSDEMSPLRWASITPTRAALSLSVPPLVNVTSANSVPSDWETVSRASSSARLARWPSACKLLGLPKASPKNGSIAARTSGRIGVVAA